MQNDVFDQKLSIVTLENNVEEYLNISILAI